MRHGAALVLLCVQVATLFWGGAFNPLTDTFPLRTLLPRRYGSNADGHFL